MEVSSCLPGWVSDADQAGETGKQQREWAPSHWHSNWSNPSGILCPLSPHRLLAGGGRALFSMITSWTQRPGLLEATETGSSEFFFLREYFQTTQGQWGQGACHDPIARYRAVGGQSVLTLNIFWFVWSGERDWSVLASRKQRHVCLYGDKYYCEWPLDLDADFNISAEATSLWSEGATTVTLHSALSKQQRPVCHQKVRHSPVPLMGNLLMTSHNSKQ